MKRIISTLLLIFALIFLVGCGSCDTCAGSSLVMDNSATCCSSTPW